MASEPRLLSAEVINKDTLAVELSDHRVAVLTVRDILAAMPRIYSKEGELISEQGESRGDPESGL